MKKPNLLAAKMSEYVTNNDCVQIMLGYKNEMILYGEEGLLYSDTNGDIEHKYLTDNRRYRFPYFNIPTHVKRVGVSKIKMTNHILNNDSFYLLYNDRRLRAISVLKKGEDTYLVYSGRHKTSREEEKMSRDELTRYFSIDYDPKRVIYQEINDGLELAEGLIMPETADIVRCYKDMVMNETEVSNYKEFVKYAIDNVSNISVPEGFSFTPEILTFQKEEDYLSISALKIFFHSEDSYKVVRHSAYVQKVTLNDLDNARVIYRKIHDARINPYLNPDINTEDIKKSESMILSKKYHGI